MSADDKGVQTPISSEQEYHPPTTQRHSTLPYQQTFPLDTETIPQV
jgi:hypothetical protein